MSARDSDNGIWCDVNAALTHLGKVEQLCKLDSKGDFGNLLKIRESEAATRAEWAKISQLNNTLSLSEIITIAAQRRSLWPSVSEFSNTKYNRNDWENRQTDSVLGAPHPGSISTIVIRMGAPTNTPF